MSGYKPEKDSSSQPVRITEPESYWQEAWEAAYARFETPKQEVRKFIKRLKKLGIDSCPRTAEVLELFCGRGNGLIALNKLGFTRLAGVDLSASLLAGYSGSAECYIDDCRQLPFANGSKDLVIVQGGLHHLRVFPEDVGLTLAEMHRVVKQEGLVVIVEPWLTPFLSFVHRLCRSNIARRLSGRIKALAAIIYYESKTYEQWLSHPQEILSLLAKYFQADRCVIAWGKLMFVGRKRSENTK